MIQASSYISPAALHIFFRYSFPSSFSLPFAPSPLFHLLFHGTLWFANLDNSGGKGDFSASFIILIVVFSTQLRCGVAGGGMLGPLRDPAPGSITSPGGF